MPGIGSLLLMGIKAPIKAARGDNVGAAKEVFKGVGAYSGAVIGSAFCPVIGTAVGGVVGGILGFVGGKILDD